MKRLFAVSALCVLAACNQTEKAPAEEEAPAADLVSSTGAVLVTLADGSKILSYSTPDGTSVGGPLEGDGTPAAWTVEGDKACIDPPGDEAKFCFKNGPAAADGTVPVVADDNDAVSFKPLGTTIAAGTTPSFGAGASLVNFKDGSTGLSVFTTDGKAFLARNPQKSTWRAVDGKRCIKGPEDEAETCSTPGPIGADGSFTATPDKGDPITVLPLS